MPTGYEPLQALFAQAYAEMPPRLLSCIETADMLIVPSARITSKGFVDRSRYRNYPPLLWKEFALGLKLYGEGHDEASGDALVLSWHNRIQQTRREAQAAEPVSANLRLLNTQALLRDLNL